MVGTPATDTDRATGGTCATTEICTVASSQRAAFGAGRYTRKVNVSVALKPAVGVEVEAPVALFRFRVPLAVLASPAYVEPTGAESLPVTEALNGTPWVAGPALSSTAFGPTVTVTVAGTQVA